MLKPPRTKPEQPFTVESPVSSFQTSVFPSGSAHQGYVNPWGFPVCDRSKFAEASYRHLLGCTVWCSCKSHMSNSYCSSSQLHCIAGSPLKHKGSTDRSFHGEVKVLAYAPSCSAKEYCKREKDLDFNYWKNLSRS